MINETSSGALDGIFVNIWNYLSFDLFGRGVEMIEAPIRNSSMLWMLLPLAATLILMEFYFGRYKEEDMGWNTAFSNALILMFVAIDLFRHLYEPSGQGLLEFLTTSSDIKIIIPIWITGMALTLMLIDFFHFIPKKLAYILSSPIYVNLISLLGLIVVYSAIPLDWTTLFAGAVLFILANLMTLVLYYIVPSYKPTISKILTVAEIEKFGEDFKRSKK